MPHSELWCSVNRHAAIHICLTIFAVLCVGAHMLAVIKIAACDGHFLIMNQQTIHNMAPIGFDGQQSLVPRFVRDLDIWGRILHAGA